jgi:hypothetical protein
VPRSYPATPQVGAVVAVADVVDAVVVVVVAAAVVVVVVVVDPAAQPLS